MLLPLYSEDWNPISPLKSITAVQPIWNAHSLNSLQLKHALLAANKACDFLTPLEYYANATAVFLR